jgi:hypothetical protein
MLLRCPMPIGKRFLPPLPVLSSSLLLSCLGQPMLHHRCNRSIPNASRLAARDPPPPAFSTTTTESIDFSIGFGFAILDSIVLEISRKLHIDFIAFCHEIRVLHTFSHVFACPTSRNGPPVTANSAPHASQHRRMRCKPLWTLQISAMKTTMTEEMNPWKGCT